MKSQATFIFLLLFLLFSSFTSCNSRRSKSLPVAGKVGEILVVSENDIWESEIKNHLDTSLTQWIMPYFPDVATFEIIHKTPEHFIQGVKRYRNILYLNIDPSYSGEASKIESATNTYARGQLSFTITSKDYDQLLETCKSGLGGVHEQFDEKSWGRLIERMSETPNTSIRSELKEKFKIDIKLPSNSSVVWRRKNFYRIEFPPASRPIEFVGTGTQDVGAIFSGLMIYQYDYKDSNQFDMSRLLKARDTMLRHNAPHEIEGLYMGTQYAKFVFPETELAVNQSGTITGLDMRGMYHFIGRPIHTTGGCFWAFHFKNPKTNKMLCLSGYVDAPPTTSWTHAIRELQAILRSVEFSE